MKTKATKETKELPEIIWERGEYIELGSYNASGESADGRKWIGYWVELQGIEITGIEEA